MALSYPKRLSADIQKISKIDREPLVQIKDALEDIKLETIRPSVIKEALQKIVSEDLASVILNVSITIGGVLSTNKELRAKKLISQILNENSIEFENIDIFSEIIENENFRIASKALFLSYEEAQIFTSASSIVDIRPVFNEKKDKIVGKIVMPSIKISFIDNLGDGRREIVLAVDESDVKNLADILSEIISKIRVIKESDSGFEPLKGFVAGEETLDRDP